MWRKTPPFTKKLSNASPKQFFKVFLENTAFFEKIVEKKNIQDLISDKKSYIHFWCKMTSDSRTMTEWPCCKQSTSTFRNISLLTHFLCHRIFFKRNIGLTELMGSDTQKTVCHGGERSSSHYGGL